MNNFLFGPGIVLITLFISTAVTLYYLIKARHIERMAKIENGIDTTPSKSSLYLELKIGMLMIGIAIGILLAYLFENLFKIDSNVFYPSFILLFGGISLIISFFMANRMSKNE